MPDESAEGYGQVKTRLRELITKWAAQDSLRLPAEAELATELRVSRATLRSALLSLQKEGLIRRLHGHGTFINRHALRMGANLAEAGAFLDLLARAGHRPAMSVLANEVVELPAGRADELESPTGSTALRIERLFFAGQLPAVHSVDFFPTELLCGAAADLSPMSSTFEFVRTHSDRPVCYSVAEVSPVRGPSAVARALRISRAEPLLRLAHTHIRADERPVATTTAHVNPKYLRFSVIRSYLDS